MQLSVPLTISFLLITRSRRMDCSMWMKCYFLKQVPLNLKILLIIALPTNFSFFFSIYRIIIYCWHVKEMQMVIAQVHCLTAIIGTYTLMISLSSHDQPVRVKTVLRSLYQSIVQPNWNINTALRGYFSNRFSFCLVDTISRCMHGDRSGF